MTTESSNYTIISSSEALEATYRAETDVAVNTAKRYPRDIQACRADALAMATMSAEIAESCYYVLPRDGKKIDGPSVRLAEIIVSAYGNIKVATRIIGNDGKMITAEAVCMDTEKNITVSVQVKRRITNKKGETYSDDMQVVTGNAASAIAYRNAVLKVIPMVLTNNVLDAAKKIAAGTEADLPITRAKALQYIHENFKVKSEQVLKILKRQSIEDITIDDIKTIKGFINAIRDGDATINEVFYGKPEPETIQVSQDEIDLAINDIKICPSLDALKDLWAALKPVLQAEDAVRAAKESRIEQLTIKK